MEVLNISVDENEADTSSDELDEDPEFQSHILDSSVHKEFVNRESISTRNGRFKDWERPAFKLLYSSSPYQAQPEPFRFLFLDSVSTISNIKHPSIPEIRYPYYRAKAPLCNVIRLFGVAQVPVYSSSQDLFDEPDFMNSKNFDDTYSLSVCCNVHGFYPYFYALSTEEVFRTEDDSLWEMIGDLTSQLNKKLSQDFLKDQNVHDFIQAGNQPIVKIEYHELKDVVNKIFHFPAIGNREKDSLVFTVVVALPIFLSAAAIELSNLQIPHYKNHPKHKREFFEFDVYENNLNNNLRFLTDQNIPGCTWLELKAGKYFHRDETDSMSCTDCIIERESHCQIELDVHYEDILKMDLQPDRIPPLRVLSLDLESRVNTQKVPKGSNGTARNQVIQIGAVVATYGAPGNPIIGKAAFVLGTCDPLPETEVLEFYENASNCCEQNLMNSEAVMLSAFRDFVIQMDPDIITGYNIKNFDLPYLINRVDRLYDNFVDSRRFPYLGRLKKVKASLRSILNKNKRMYSFDHKVVNIQGRIIMDMYPLFKRHVPDSRPLKLKDVARMYLASGEEKDDVKYTEINGLQDGTSKTRNRLAKYCVQDSYLPVKLMLVHMPDRKSAKVNFVQYYYEQARLGGTIFRYLVNKSRDYNKYFKQVLVQKNDGKVKYLMDSPSPKKVSGATKDTLAADAPSPPPKQKPSSSTSRALPLPKPVQIFKPKKKNCSRMLFTDEDD